MSKFEKGARLVFSLFLIGVTAVLLVGYTILASLQDEEI